MHVLFIPSWYSTPANPIRGSFFRDQALALRKAGHQVGMLVPPSRLRTWHGLDQMRRNWRRASHDLDIEQDSGLVIYRIPRWGWTGSLLRSQRDALGLAAFDRYCQEQGQPDIVHGHSLLYGGYLAAVIKAQRGIPAVVTEHSSVYIRGPVWPDQRPALRLTLTNVDRVFAVSAPLAEALRAYTNRPVQILPNAIDTAFFTPAADAPPPSPISLAWIGRLDSNKAPDLTLRAFAAAFPAGTARLIMVGDGPARPSLEELCHALGITGQVTFTGQLPREQVRATLQACHATVSSSRVETFGITLIEAMACGKPVIATRSGGPEVFVNETTGLLVPTGDVDALAAAMRQMAATYDRYDPAAIRAHCVDNFSNAALVRRLEAVYAEVIAQPASSPLEGGTPG